MSITPMSPHYSMENPASIYDEEAMTALELAGRTLGKVNECVETVNQVQRVTENTLENQNKTINTMNTVTMPAKVKEEVQAHINRGDFNRAIDAYAGNLEARVDNMLSNVPAGSTTMDAEVIDGRVSEHNVTYPNIGDAIRANDALKMDASFTKTPLDITIVRDKVWRRLVDDQGRNEQTSATDHYARYNLKGEKILSVSGRTFVSDWFPAFMFYDSSNNVIYYHYVTAYTSVTDYIIAVPSNASYIIMNGTSSAPAELYACQQKTIEELLAGGDGVSINPSMLDGYKMLDGTVAVTMALNNKNTEIETGIIHTSYPVSNPDYSTLFVPVERNWRAVHLDEYNVGTVGGCFMDENHTFITDSNFSTAYPANLTAKAVPEGAKYIAISAKNADLYNNIYIDVARYALEGLETDSTNPWSGKKVVWMGTSIPYGERATKSYAKECANWLNFELVPAVRPGLSTHRTNGKSRGGVSLVNSIAEYLDEGITIPDTPPAWTPGGAYNGYYTTYENVFGPANADADLFVYDLLPNNGNFSASDWEAFDHENWQYKDGSSFESHRETFLGAMLFLMDKMYKLNPLARMVLVVGCSLNYDAGLANYKLLSEKYKVPIINLWEKANTAPPHLAKLFYSETDHHLTTFAHERLGRMLYGEMLTIA